jgi:hypothetical protein
MIGWVEELIRTSTLDEDAKQRVETQLGRPDLTLAEYHAIRNKLKENQPKKF